MGCGPVRVVKAKAGFLEKMLELMQKQKEMAVWGLPLAEHGDRDRLGTT